MIDIDVTIFIQLANFLIMWLVLNLILFKPIRGIIKKRSEVMQAQMDSIDSFSKDAEAKLKGYESALDAARKVGVDERNKLKEEGVTREHKLLSDAGKQAASRVADEKAKIESEVSTAMQALKGKVGGMAKQAADRVLGHA